MYIGVMADVSLVGVSVLCVLGSALCRPAGNKAYSNHLMVYRSMRVTNDVNSDRFLSRYGTQICTKR